MVDTTYSNLRFAGGPLYSANTNLDTTDKVTEALNQDLIIRAFSIVASIDERDIASRKQAVTNLEIFSLILLIVIQYLELNLTILLNQNFL